MDSLPARLARTVLEWLGTMLFQTKACDWSAAVPELARVRDEIKLVPLARVHVLYCTAFKFREAMNSFRCVDEIFAMLDLEMRNHTAFCCW